MEIAGQQQSARKPVQIEGGYGSGNISERSGILSERSVEGISQYW